MTTIATRRPLEDLLAELVAGLGGIARAAEGPMAVRPDSVEFRLPIETRVAAGDDGLVVIADLPRTRTRTDFDLPLGQLAVRLAAEDLR